MSKKNTIPISSHTFILPFVYQEFKSNKNPSWERLSNRGEELPHLKKVVDSDEIAQRNLYGYQRYFNSEAKEISFRKEELVENYLYKQEKDSYYRISYYQDNNEKDELCNYDLPIRYIMLRILPTLNAGFLIISADNNDYTELKDIKKINQYGRRIYNPFQSIRLSFTEAPNNLEIIDISQLGAQPSATDYLMRYQIMDAPMELLQSFFGFENSEIFPETEENQAKISTIIDDRMFVHSFIRDNSFEDLIKKTSQFSCLTDDELRELYALAYIDKEASSCQSEDMVEKLVDVAAYRRWADYNSLYLSTQHSFLYLATPSVPDFLFYNFQSIYLEAVLIVLAQRVGILKFSQDAGNKVGATPESLLELQASYVTFKNQYLLPEISAQEQAIELYELLQSSLYISKYSEMLDQQITALHEIGQTKEAVAQQRKDDELNIKLLILTIIAAVPVVADVLENFIATLGLHDDVKKVILLFNPENWEATYKFLIFVLVSCVAYGYFERNKGK